jgi:hypothetical protein
VLRDNDAPVKIGAETGIVTMRVLMSMFAIVVLSAIASAPARADCPPNASPSYEAGGVVHCKCNSGYENRGGECKPIPTMQAMPEPTMRAQTRAECIGSAGRQLRADLKMCKPPIVACMTKAGVRIHEATCAASTLVSALALAADPSKVSTAVAGPAVVGAVVVCGREAYDAVEKCEPDWGTCPEEPLKAHKRAVDDCPSK